jgi:RNA polymerase sigma-32 factor
MPMTAQPDSFAIRSLLRRPPLTAERERQLLVACRTGGGDALRQHALAELAHCHSKLVQAVARQFQRPDLTDADLLEAGHRGMQAAVDEFDPRGSDTRLCGYAVGWIRQYIEDYIERQPECSAAFDALRQLAIAAPRLFAEARRACRRECVEASERELCARVAARMGLAPDQVERWRRSKRRSRDGGDAADPDAIGPSFADAKLRPRVTALSQDILGVRERKVFLARCMTDPSRVRRRESLAAELGVSRERIYQLEVSAKRKIAVALAQKALPAVLDPPNPRALRCAVTVS